MQEDEPPTKVTRVSPALPSSEWQVDVLAQADRLESQLDRAKTGDPDDTTRAQGLIAQARLIATGQVKVNWFRDWLAGIRVESAWRCLQQAQEELLLVRPKTELQAEVSYWRQLAASMPADPDRDNKLGVWESGDPDQIDPVLARTIVEAAHVKTNTDHMQVRRLRNRVLALAAMVAVVVVALWIGEVTTGAVVGIGALGGLISVVFIVKGADVAAAYNVQVSQALLKVASGAGTAILAVAILKGTGASAQAVTSKAPARGAAAAPAGANAASSR